MNYDWPGNVRELSNIIERAVVIDQADLIAAEHLYLDYVSSPDPRQAKDALPLGMTLRELERRFIETLQAQHNDQQQAAKIRHHYQSTEREAQ